MSSLTDGQKAKIRDALRVFLIALVGVLLGEQAEPVELMTGYGDVAEEAVIDGVTDQLTIQLEGYEICISAAAEPIDPPEPDPVDPVDPEPEPDDLSDWQKLVRESFPGDDTDRLLRSSQFFQMASIIQVDDSLFDSADIGERFRQLQQDSQSSWEPAKYAEFNALVGSEIEAVLGVADGEAVPLSYESRHRVAELFKSVGEALK